jgi:hypothetical protein
MPISPSLSVKMVAAAAFGMGVALCVALQNGYFSADARAEAGANPEELFMRMATVFAHPRCMNCHTGELFPRQGDDEHRHAPNVVRGPNGNGAAGLHCSTCHQEENQAASGVPGAPDWHLAPVPMAWQGLSAGDLCRALRDPARGAMPPDQLLAHFDTALVRWAWAPGKDRSGGERTTPPLSHEEFMAIAKAWIDAGAVCPK